MYTSSPQSTFELIAKPSNYAFDLLQSDGKSKVKGYLLGWVVFPVTVAATSLTIISDLIIGIFQAASLYINQKKFDKGVKDILKMSVSFSIQQLVFASIATGLAWGIFKKQFNIPSLMILSLWPVYYVAGRFTVSLLPEILIGKNKLFQKDPIKNEITLEESIKNKVEKLKKGSRTGVKIRDIVVNEVIYFAKTNKFPVITKDLIEEQNYFQPLTKIIVFELIVACDKDNKKEIANELVRLTGHPFNFIEELIENKMKLTDNEINKCKTLFTLKDIDAGKETDAVHEFFKKIGVISTAGLSNKNFYKFLDKIE